MGCDPIPYFPVKNGLYGQIICIGSVAGVYFNSNVFTLTMFLSVMLYNSTQPLQKKQPADPRADDAKQSKDPRADDAKQSKAPSSDVDNESDFADNIKKRKKKPAAAPEAVSKHNKAQRRAAASALLKQVPK